MASALVSRKRSFDVSRETDGSPVYDPLATPHLAKRMKRAEPQLPPVNAEEEDQLIRWMPKRCRKRFRKAGNDDLVMNKREIRATVEEGFREYRAQLDLQFKQALQEQLQAQYQQFSRYVEDQLRQKDTVANYFS